MAKALGHPMCIALSQTCKMLQKFASLDANNRVKAFKIVSCLEQYTHYTTIEGSGKFILNATGRATNISSVLSQLFWDIQQENRSFLMCRRSQIQACHHRQVDGQANGTCLPRLRDRCACYCYWSVHSWLTSFRTFWKCCVELCTHDPKIVTWPRNGRCGTHSKARMKVQDSDRAADRFVREFKAGQLVQPRPQTLTQQMRDNGNNAPATRRRIREGRCD